MAMRSTQHSTNRAPAGFAGADGIQYPAPFVVRNTFIDVHTERSDSLEGFFLERQIVSAPGSKISQPGSACEDGAVKLGHMRQPSTKSSEDEQSDCSTADTADQAQPPSPRFDNARPVTVRLADSISGCLGSPELPTVGSMGHYAGDCKPCAFVNTRGCGNGVHCPYCHLCEPGEKKRRQKEKKAFFKAMHAEVQRFFA